MSGWFAAQHQPGSYATARAAHDKAEEAERDHKVSRTFVAFDPEKIGYRICGVDSDHRAQARAGKKANHDK